MWQKNLEIVVATMLVVAIMVGALPPSTALAQEEVPVLAPAGVSQEEIAAARAAAPEQTLEIQILPDGQILNVTNQLFLPLTRYQLDCPEGWETRWTGVPLDTYQLARETATPERYVSFHNNAWGGVIEVGEYCYPVDPEVSWYETDGRDAQWNGQRSVYASATLVAVADGPAPFGDAVAVGLLASAGGVQIIGTIYRMSGDIAVPTFSGWQNAGTASVVQKTESWGSTQVSYFESPDTLWDLETVWVIPQKTDDTGSMGAVIDTPGEDLYIYTQQKSGAIQSDDFGSILVESSARPNIKGSIPLNDAQRRQVAQRRWPVVNPDGSVFDGGFEPGLIKPKVPGAYEPHPHVSQHGDESLAGDGKDVSFAQTASYRYNEWAQAQARAGVTTGPRPECFEGTDRNGNKAVAVFVRAAVWVWENAAWVLKGNGSWNLYYTTPKPKSASFWTQSSTPDTSDLAGVDNWTPSNCGDGPFNPGGQPMIPAVTSADND